MKERRPIRLFIPNTITLINLALGCLAVMEAWNNRPHLAALFIMICAVLDFFDGYAARMLKAYSGLGKQLDSLADLVSFGVAPAAVAAVLLKAGAVRSHWPTGGIAGLLLVLLPLFVPLFSALRLARFNIEEHTESHFRGMPVPADAAAFAALGLMYGNGKFPLLESWLLHPVSILVLIVLNSWLMVSPAAMFSFKLKSYRPAGNAWRYIFAATALILVIIFRGTGLFAAFILYVLASLGMNIRIRVENSSAKKP